MKSNGPSSGSAIIITLTAVVLVASGLTVRSAAGPLGQDRAATAMFRGRPIAAGEVLVAFRQTPDLAGLRADLDSDADALIGTGRVWRARSRSKNVSALLALLAARHEVLYAEPNYMLFTTAVPNDLRFPELWGLQNTGQTISGVPGTPGADISAVPAWDLALGSRNTVVGIVDTGIDYTHPDLAGNVWSAPAKFSVTIGGQTITCAAGTHGFNAILKTCDPLDDHFHGTHVSGTIGAVGNNGAGVTGINWFASLMGLKFLSASGSGSAADAINAIEFAIQAKAVFSPGGANVRVLSNSWSGGGFSQALFDEITRASQNDILFVAAAGNSATNNDDAPAYPSSYLIPNVVAVAATDNQDALASFSNYGAASVHLGAPGVKVLSTVLNGAYNSFSGTSMATPHVSGAAALLLSRCTLDTPSLKTLLLASVDQIPALLGRTITGGRLNVGRAIAACGRAGNVSPMVTLTDPAPDATYSAPATIVVRGTAADADGAVAQVAFFDGTALIGTAIAPPYQLTWTNAPVGNHTVTAVATDNDGATTTSAATVVHVLPGLVPFGGTATPIPGIVEAENFNEGGEGVGYHDLTAGNLGGKYRQTDVDVEVTSDVGGGFSIGYVDAGEWLAYTVSVAATTDYTLDARVASQGAGGVFHVEADGIDVTGPMTVPNTGGWQTWQTLTRTGIPLTAGSHVLRVVFDLKGSTGWVGNLNAFRWTSPGINALPAVQVTAPADGAIYLAPATIALAASASDLDGTVTQVAFYSGSSLLGTDTTSPFTLAWTNVPVGNYTVTAVATDNSGASTASGPVTIHVVVPPSSTPLGGIAAAIPGLIEAENFDEGGEGISYHDLTKGNSGGKYRQTDVDIETTSDVGGGYSLGFVAAGEWLKYTVAVAATGSYALEARIASPGTGATFHVEVDGLDATGPTAVPNTGGWQTWRSIAVGSIPLAAGSHVLRLVFDTNGTTGWFGNVNFLRWTVSTGNPPPGPPTPTPFGGVAAAIPGVVEAENFDEGGEGVAYHDVSAGNSGGQYRSTDVDIEATSDVGGGYSIGFISAGEWLKYSVSVATSGSYTLDARVASPGPGGTFHVEVDGVDATGPLVVPNTGGWQTWRSVIAPGIALSAGPHLLRLVFDANGAFGWFGNVNALRWTLPSGSVMLSAPDHGRSHPLARWEALGLPSTAP